ncbi:hypothetical protein Sjap_015648 [Stephania japonica]|uniref:Uncharacterized protein n=1 Tax=Stephania japonica TaxID=461633 RepID=A0AAP0IL41_9MAGN
MAMWRLVAFHPPKPKDKASSLAAGRASQCFPRGHSAANLNRANVGSPLTGNLGIDYPYLKICATTYSHVESHSFIILLVPHTKRALARQRTPEACETQQKVLREVAEAVAIREGVTLARDLEVSIGVIESDSHLVTTALCQDIWTKWMALSSQRSLRVLTRHIILVSCHPRGSVVNNVD